MAKKLKDVQERNVDRLMNMMDRMSDEKFEDFGVSNAYQTLEMMVQFDEAGAERKVEALKTPTTARGEVAPPPDSSAGKRSLAELAARQKALLAKASGQTEEDCEIETAPAPVAPKPALTRPTTPLTAPKSPLTAPRSPLTAPAAKPTTPLTAPSAPKPVVQAAAPAPMTAEQKIEMAKRLFFEAQTLQAAGKPLTPNHQKAVAFINQQKKVYQEAAQSQKEGKPLTDIQKSAVILINAMKKQAPQK